MKKVYTTQDIRAIYTRKISELFAQGYQIHFESMGGSQGEIAHIDLTNGSEVLRVLMRQKGTWGENYGDILTITVGKCTTQLPGSYQTIWNNQLEPRFEIKFDKLREGIYTTVEDGKACANKRRERYKAKREPQWQIKGDAFKPIALKWLRRQPKMKTCKLEDISEIRLQHTRDGRIRYDIQAKGKGYVLMA